jgi:hypothetical protein
MKVHARDSTSNSCDRRVLTWWQLCRAVYQWATWFFVCSMVFSQFLCIVWDSTTTVIHYDFGRDPWKGIGAIVGRNDAPFVDRVITCVHYGAGYIPELVSQALSTDDAIKIGGSIGYRVIDRRTNAQLDSVVFTPYQATCNLIADTLDNIFSACTALGYSNLTRDHLRIALDDNTFAIADSLPILVMPFYDNALNARYAIPSLDGDACVFRLIGTYIDQTWPDATFRGANKTIRNSRTIEWLGRPGGKWEHGWYVDPTGVRWGSEVVSTNPTTEFGTMIRQFDMQTGMEVDCTQTTKCNNHKGASFSWGSKFTVSSTVRNLDSIYVGDATQQGLFRYRSTSVRFITNKYDWETLLSNASILLLLVRWQFSTLALYRGYYRRETEWHNSCIWCLSDSRSFKLFLLSVLPRLKMTLCAICTVGCNFEGSQLGLSDAWFAVYPSIVEFMVLLYSLINIVAKVCRRRVTDKMFVPTIVLLCITHYFRIQLSFSGWLQGVQGRVPTLVSSDEVSKLVLLDFFRSDVAVRLNGNVRELFIGKLVLFGVNLLPLVLSKPLPVFERNRHFSQDVSQIEQAMAVNCTNVGGLGMQNRRINKSRTQSRRARIGPTTSIIANIGAAARQQIANSSSPVSNSTSQLPSANKVILSSDELIRLGYVVYGGKFVIKFDDWDIISLFAPLRSLYHLWNHRVTVWTLKDDSVEEENQRSRDVSNRCRRLLHLEPEVMRLDDPRLLRVPFWHISACDIE